MQESEFMDILVRLEAHLVLEGVLSNSATTINTVTNKYCKNWRNLSRTR